MEKCVKKHHLYIEITKDFTPEGIAVNLAAYDDKKKSLKASGQLLHFETERQFVEHREELIRTMEAIEIF